MSPANHGHSDDFLYCISFADELKPIPVHLSQCGHYVRLEDIVCWSCSRTEKIVDAELRRISAATEKDEDTAFLLSLGVAAL
jgi:hypothetical protein